MKPDSSNSPSPEITDLIVRYGEQRLEPKELGILENHLREDETAREFFADRLRFDAEIHEVLNPPQQLEWTETRNLVMKDGKNWEIQRHQTLRSGMPPEGGGKKNKVRHLPMLLIALGILIVGLVSYIFWPAAKSEPKISELILRNGNFEETDLTFATTGKNSVVIGWQDYFTTDHVSIAEIARTSDGQIFAKSGRNVAMLWDYGFLTQQLHRADGTAIQARSGMHFRVSGWAYVMEGREPYGLRAALRFVATGKPGMIQYELAHDEVRLEAGGWQHFTMEMTLPDDLELLPSDVDRGMQPPPATNLSGRKLTLSLDSRCAGGILLLDNLKIEEMKP